MIIKMENFLWLLVSLHKSKSKGPECFVHASSLGTALFTMYFLLFPGLSQSRVNTDCQAIGENVATSFL